MLKCTSFKRARKYDNFCEEISKMYTFLLYYYYFLPLGGGRTYESPFTPHKWAKEKVPQVWQGDINKRRPDRFHCRTCVQTEWSVEPVRMSRSVSNRTPGK